MNAPSSIDPSFTWALRSSIWFSNFIFTPSTFSDAANALTFVFSSKSSSFYLFKLSLLLNFPYFLQYFHMSSWIGLLIMSLVSINGRFFVFNSFAFPSCSFRCSGCFFTSTAFSSTLLYLNSEREPNTDNLSHTIAEGCCQLQINKDVGIIHVIAMCILPLIYQYLRKIS